ncbi:MAG: methyltransferase domain-containing protein, partial [Anaerolineales bacterium]
TPKYLGGLKLKYCLEDLEGVSGKVLEIGCGGGAMMRAIKRYRPDLEVHGLDLSRTALSVALDAGGDVKYASGDAHGLPIASASHDAVVMLDVLEHLPDPNAALTEVHRIMKPSGTFHLYCPLEGDIRNLHGILHRLGWRAKEKLIGHIQNYTEAELYRQLNSSGLFRKDSRWSGHAISQIVDVAYFSWLEVSHREKIGSVEAPLYTENSSKAGRLLRALTKAVSVIMYAESLLVGWLPASGVHVGCIKQKKSRFFDLVAERQNKSSMAIGSAVRSKLGAAFGLLRNRPSEAVDWLGIIAEAAEDTIRGRPQNIPSVDLPDMLEDLEILGIEPYQVDEGLLLGIEKHVAKATHTIADQAPFALSHSADIHLSQFLYMMCRAIKPQVVIETGVGYGASSAFILKAMEANGIGELHSIDIPPLSEGSEEFIGVFVPEHLAARWILHRGTSRTVRPRLLEEVGQVDLFIHDSAHTYRTVTFELSIVLPYLNDRAVVVVDDADCNWAFSEHLERSQPTRWYLARGNSKGSLFGVSVHMPINTRREHG